MADASEAFSDAEAEGMAPAALEGTFRAEHGVGAPAVAELEPDARRELERHAFADSRLGRRAGTFVLGELGGNSHAFAERGVESEVQREGLSLGGAVFENGAEAHPIGVRGHAVDVQAARRAVFGKSADVGKIVFEAELRREEKVAVDPRAAVQRDEESRVRAGSRTGVQSERRLAVGVVMVRAERAAERQKPFGKLGRENGEELRAERRVLERAASSVRTRGTAVDAEDRARGNGGGVGEDERPEIRRRGLLRDEEFL